MWPLPRLQNTRRKQPPLNCSFAGFSNLLMFIAYISSEGFIRWIAVVIQSNDVTIGQHTITGLGHYYRASA